MILHSGGGCKRMLQEMKKVMLEVCRVAIRSQVYIYIFNVYFVFFLVVFVLKYIVQ